MLSPSQSFCIPLARREESFSISKAPASPPLPPLRKGGKWIGRSRPRWIARNKNTRLETVPPVRSRPTLQRARASLALPRPDKLPIDNYPSARDLFLADPEQPNT